MSPETFLKNALVPALGLLPIKMDSPAARAMIIAICLQESRLMHRRQVNGPARGYAQFELAGGVHGVLRHPASQQHIRSVLVALDYNVNADENQCYQAIEHNDILAAAFARLLLWTLPQALPKISEQESGWTQYLTAWRPGAPHLSTWAGNFATAWDTVLAAG